MIPHLVRAAAAHFPLSSVDEVFFGGTLDWYDDWVANPYPGDRFWERFVSPDVWADIDVPALMLSGYFDVFAYDAPADYTRTLAAAGRDVRLIMGPWNHSMGLLETHDVDMAAAGSLLGELNRINAFLDLHVRGQGNSNWGPVRMYDPGTQHWLERDELFDAAATPRRFQLSAGGGAVGCQVSGGLVESGDVAGEFPFDVDPAEVIGRLGGASLGFAQGGARLQPEFCDATGATFLGEPLTTATRIDGTVELSIAVRTTAEDGAFVGRLSRVDASGEAILLGQGAMAIRHRKGHRPASYSPGETVTLAFELGAYVWTLQPGERLRLDITGPALPQYLPYPNVASDPHLADSPVAATQTILVGDGASTLTVPMVTL